MAMVIGAKTAHGRIGSPRPGGPSWAFSVSRCFEKDYDDTGVEFGTGDGPP
jgi:hypothetical protein